MPPPSPRSRRKVAASGACIATLLSGGARAHAADYEADVRVADERDLLDLHARGAIGDATLEVLLDLLRTPIELAHAPAERLYALPGLSWAEAERIAGARAGGACLDGPEALARAAELPEDRLPGLSPFVSYDAACAAPRAPARARGWLELRGRHLVGAPGTPPALLRSRVQPTGELEFGLSLLTTRLSPGPAAYDPARQALLAAPPGPRVRAPSLFARWRRGRMTWIAGNFRTGFGERLTLDDSARPLPDGFYPDIGVVTPSGSARLCPYSAAGGGDAACEHADRRTTADFRAGQGMRGLALELRDLPVSADVAGTLHAFASYQGRDIYQYALRDRARCPDGEGARRDCQAPPVLDARAPERRYAYLTLPDVRDELTLGGHLGITTRFLRAGVIGYHTRIHWRLPGLDADVQRWSRHPGGDRFGALGVHVVLGLGPIAWHTEAAHSHGGIGPGGPGAITRALVSAAAQEWELSLRYFGPNYENPMARPLAAPDLVDGLAARDEAGLRLRWWHAAAHAWRLRATADLWRPAAGLLHGGAADPTSRGTALRGRMTWRADRSGPLLRELSLWGEHGGCRAPAPEAAATDGDGCPPDRHRVTARVAAWTRGRRLSLAVQQSLALRAGPAATSAARDSWTWLDAGWHPTRTLTLHLRARHLWRDLARPGRGERSLLAALDLDWRRAGWDVRLRHAVLAMLDARPGTLRRWPNPEHTVQLEIEHRF